MAPKKPDEEQDSTPNFALDPVAAWAALRPMVAVAPGRGEPPLPTASGDAVPSTIAIPTTSPLAPNSGAPLPVGTQAMPGLDPDAVAASQSVDAGYRSDPEHEAPAPPPPSDAPSAMDPSALARQPAAPTPSAPALPSGQGMLAAPGISMAGFDRAAQAEKDATQAATAAQVAQDQAVAAQQQKQADDQARGVALLQKHTAEAADQAQHQHDAFMAELNRTSPSPKLDPERWWKSRTDGQRVAGVIALVLGGIGEAFGAKSNSGADAINDAIARDVEAQKENILSAREDRRDKLAGMNTAFGQFMQLTGNAQAAESMALEWGQRQAHDQIAATIANTKSPITKANGLQALAVIDARRAQQALQTKQILVDLGLKTAQINATNEETEVRRAEVAQKQARLANGMPPMEDAVLQGDRWVPVGDKKAAEQLNNAAAGMVALVQTGQELHKLVDSEGWNLRLGMKGAPERVAGLVGTMANASASAQGYSEQVRTPELELFQHNLNAGVFDTPEKLHNAINGFVSSAVIKGNALFNTRRLVSPLQYRAQQQAAQTPPTKPFGGQ